MEAIGREKFEEMATKMGQLDQSQSQNVALLTSMFGSTSNELRDRMLAHERSLQELHSKLAVLERSAQNIGSAPRDFGGSRLKIPDPAGWKLDVLKGRGDGFQLWRERFDLQTESIWHGEGLGDAPGVEDCG